MASVPIGLGAGALRPEVILARLLETSSVLLEHSPSTPPIITSFNLVGSWLLEMFRVLSRHGAYCTLRNQSPGCREIVLKTLINIIYCDSIIFCVFK